MKVRVRLPSGELKSVATDLTLNPCQFLSSLSAMIDLDFSLCQLKLGDETLDPRLPLTDQRVREGDVLEVETPGTVDLAYCDIAKRRKSLKDWMDFFTELTQRLVPAQEYMTPEYVKLVLAGQKETLRLLDVRNYRYPQWMYTEDELSPSRLLKYCLMSPVLRQFVTKDCLDQGFLIKVIATLDYGQCEKIQRDLKLRKSVQSPAPGTPVKALSPTVLITPEPAKSRGEKPTPKGKGLPSSATKKHKPPRSDTSSDEVYHSDYRSSDESDTLVVPQATPGASANSAIELD